MGVATDNYGGDGSIYSWQAGFAMVELDVETGHVDILEYIGWADCGIVIHPRSLHAQELGGSIQGMGMAMTQRWVFDPRYGVPFANRLYTARPPGFMDVPRMMSAGSGQHPRSDDAGRRQGNRRAVRRCRGGRIDDGHRRCDGRELPVPDATHAGHHSG